MSDIIIPKGVSNIKFAKEDTSYDYNGVIGKALLEYRTGIKDYCAAYDPFGLCNIMECLYCENCYYKITLENGESISNCDIDLNTLSNNREFEDENHEILFYDYVPKIDDLFNYLFDEQSQFRVVRTSDNLVTNDYVKTRKLGTINNNINYNSKR